MRLSILRIWLPPQTKRTNSNVFQRSMLWNDFVNAGLCIQRFLEQVPWFGCQDAKANVRGLMSSLPTHGSSSVLDHSTQPQIIMPTDLRWSSFTIFTVLAQSCECSWSGWLSIKSRHATSVSRLQLRSRISYKLSLLDSEVQTCV